MTTKFPTITIQLIEEDSQMAFSKELARSDVPETLEDRQHFDSLAGHSRIRAQVCLGQMPDIQQMGMLSEHHTPDKRAFVGACLMADLSDAVAAKLFKSDEFPILDVANKRI